MSAWRWLWVWFGEPERPPRRPQGEGPVGDPVPGYGEVAAGRGGRPAARPARRARRALPRATRAELERSLGADLADLSLTIDPAFTAALDARAVQLGSTIVLGDPTDAHALPLLAHEASHVVQAGRRGVRPGIGAPGDAGERSATRAAGALAGSRPASGASGPPVAAIQRQAAAPGETRGVGEREPEAVRMLLMLAYAERGGQGDFVWSDRLAEGFRRLLPGVALDRLQTLWEPPPAHPAEALARLEAAGVLPSAAATTPLEPAAQPPMPEAAAPAEMAPREPEPVEEPAPVEPELQPAIEEPVPAPAEELAIAAEEPILAPAAKARKGLDVALVVTLPQALPEAFARAAPVLRRGLRVAGPQLRALGADRGRARQVYEELLAGASLEPNARAGLAELLADLAWQSAVMAEGAGPAVDGAPGAPWHAADGRVMANGAFADLLAALARHSGARATLSFRS